MISAIGVRGKMSFHPEQQKGFVEDLRCPYCDSEDIEYTGDTRTESGVCDTYDITEGECMECGKKVMIVERIETVVAGCYKGE